MKKLLLVTTALIAVAEPAHAGPVAAAVAWVGGVMGGSAGALAAFAMRTAVGFGLSAISNALMARNQPQAKADVSFDVQMGDDLPLSFIVGDYVTAGRRKYIGSWGKNTRFITEVIEVSSLPQGLESLWVNDELGEYTGTRRGYVSATASAGNLANVTDGASVPADALEVGRPLENGRAEPPFETAARIWVKWVDGTQAAADPFLVWAFGGDPDYPWTAEMVGRGKTYAIVTTRYDNDSLTSYPTFLFKPAPLPVYDLRFDSTNGGSGPQRWSDPATWQPSRNNAVVAYNIARGVRYGSEWVFGGKNLPAWRLPAAEWMAAANACDDAVSLQGGGTEPRYRCGMEVRVDMEPASVLEEIGKAANMKFAEVGGRLKPIVDLPGAAVLHITDGDILITEGQSFNPFYPVSETFNAISATYPEPGEKWASKDAPEYIDAAAQAEDGQYLPTSMTYGAAPYARQVQRLMRSQLDDFRRMRRHRFYLPPDAYGLEPGIDLISWTSNRNGYINKLFMVESVSKTPGMNVAVSLREVDPSDYDWSSDFEMPVIITPPKNVRPFVQAVPGLTFSPAIIQDEGGNARRPAILATCDPDQAGVTHIQIQGRVEGGDISIDTERAFVEPHRWYLQPVLPATRYQCRARLMSDLTPKSEWSVWIEVTTPNVCLSRLDLEAEILEKLDNLEEWLDGTDAFIDGRLAPIREDMAEIAGRVTAVREDLVAEAEELEQRILTEAGISRSYTDTAVLSEAVIRQEQGQQLAARIDALSAALVSDNLIANGQFLNGLDGWTPTGAAAVTAKNEASSSATVRSMPAPFAISLTPGDAVARLTDMFSVAATDAVQVRFAAGADSGARSVRVDIRWFDTAQVEITPAASQTVVATGGGLWSRLAARFEPPAGARRAEIKATAASASGSAVRITNIEVTLVNTAIEARVAELEAARVSAEAAFAMFRDEALARFGDAFAAIVAEGQARATADGAAADRLDQLEVTSGAQAAQISQQATAIADAKAATAQLEESVAATFGAAEIISDPVFAHGLSRWLMGSLGSDGSIVQRDTTPGMSWVYQTMPANRALRILSGATGQCQSIPMPVKPGEILDFSFDYARASNGVVPAMQYRFRRPDNSFVGTDVPAGSQTILGSGSGRWLTARETGIVVPEGAVSAEARLWNYTNGVNNCFVTNISLRRRQAVDYQTAADISVLKQADADLDEAIAFLRQTVSANWSSLDGRVRSQASAIDNRYTKTQTDSAIADGISEFNASLTSRFGAKANASTVTALTNRVTATESGLEAQSDAITQTEARTDRASARGLMRVTSSAGTTSGSTRIGIIAEATANAATQQAGLFIETNTSGENGVYVVANRFAVAASRTAGAARKVPFYIEGGDVVIDAAMISNVIQSDNFVAGENGRGWRILKSGAAEFNTVTIRRQIQVASGSLNVGNFLPRSSESRIATLEDGPGYVRTILATAVPIAAWQGTKRTYIASAGMTGTVSSPDSGNAYWGWTADVLPLTKWSGNQSLRLRLSFWSQSVSAVQNCVVTWKIYEVS